MRDICSSLQTIRNPGRYYLVQATCITVVITFIALSIFSEQLGKYHHWSPSSLRLTHLGIAGGVGCMGVLTHIFWKRTNQEKIDQDTYLLSTLKAQHDLERTAEWETLPEASSSEVKYVAGKEYKTCYPNRTVRFPTSVVTSLAVKYELFVDLEQIRHLDHQFVYVAIPGDGDCFYTALAAGFFYQLLGLWKTNSQKANAHYDEFVNAAHTLPSFSYTYINHEGIGTNYRANTNDLIGVLDQLKSNPNLNTLKTILSNPEIVRHFSAFLRCYRDGKNQVTTGSGQDAVADNDMRCPLKWRFSTFVIPDLQKDALQEAGLRSEYYPESDPDTITIFYTPGHFDLLISRKLLKTIFGCDEEYLSRA